MTRYDLFYFALAPVAVPVIAWRALTKSKYRESLPGMFGRGWNPADPSLWQNGSIWLHAVSYGEAMAAKALLPLCANGKPTLALGADDSHGNGAKSCTKFPASLRRPRVLFPSRFISGGEALCAHVPAAPNGDHGDRVVAKCHHDCRASWRACHHCQRAHFG